MARLIPACFTNGDKKTAHKHFGELVSSVCILEQQAGGTFTLALWAAPAHGLKLAAATFNGVFPHSPAASVSLTYACEASKKMTMATRGGVKLEAILVKLSLKKLSDWWGGYIHSIGAWVHL